MIKVKEGVTFIYSPGGLSILNAIKTVSKLIAHDLTITSGSDGIHSGPDDPHYKGDAYDIRSHDLDAVVKQQVLANLNNLLPREHFYYFIENTGQINEHFHIQVRNNTHFSIDDFLSA